RLVPTAAIDTVRVRALIADLESEQFAVRQSASKELESFGEKITDELRQALGDRPTLEQKRRVESLLAAARFVRNPETLRRLRAIHVLEHVGSQAARQILANLVSGLPAARETQDAAASLQRL